jgi:large conductance mechanosensitive channel
LVAAGDKLWRAVVDAFRRAPAWQGPTKAGAFNTQALASGAMRGVIDEFREFALEGNVMDMAVGIVLGAAFGTIVNSLVEDVLMPPIALATAGVDVSQLHVVLAEGDPPGPYRTLEAARQAGAVTINYGEFLTSVIAFAIVALALFFLVRTINRLRREAEDPDEVDPSPSTKTCPFCASGIPVKARRCPNCTSELSETQGGPPP